MLSVRFVEMQRTTAKNLRLNVNRSNYDPASGASRSGDAPYVSVFTGDTNLNPLGTALDSFGKPRTTASSVGSGVGCGSRSATLLRPLPPQAVVRSSTMHQAQRRRIQPS